MTSNSFKSFFERIKNREDMAILDGATDDQIVSFERENGVTIPQKYKEWLILSDGGEFYLPAGLQLYGVAHKPIIDVTISDRPDDSYIVIGALSFGDPILFKRGSEQIYIYNHEDGTIAEDETYNDFLAFINDLSGIVGVEE